MKKIMRILINLMIVACLVIVVGGCIYGYYRIFQPHEVISCEKYMKIDHCYRVQHKKTEDNEYIIVLRYGKDEFKVNDMVSYNECIKHEGEYVLCNVNITEYWDDKKDIHLIDIENEFMK